MINKEIQSRHLTFGQQIIKQETIQQCNYNSAEFNRFKALPVFFSVFNPLMAVAAIWRFEVITRAAVCLNPADMYLYAFQCSMRLF